MMQSIFFPLSVDGERRHLDIFAQVWSTVDGNLLGYSYRSTFFVLI
jgi:hypothetical protein